MGTLQDKQVLIVGGSSGIGLKLAELVLAEGGKITLVGRDLSKLKFAQDILGSAKIISADITQEENARSIFEQDINYDHIAISAANNPLPVGSIHSITLEDAKYAMLGKFWAAYTIAKYAKLHEYGSLTFISGILSTRPGHGTGLISAINAALVGLSRALALDMAPIRVNVVSPGILTNASILHNLSEESINKILNNIPLRKFGTPIDIAQSILFLMTNPFITGSTLTIDGGRTIAL